MYIHTYIRACIEHIINALRAEITHYETIIQQCMYVCMYVNMHECMHASGLQGEGSSRGDGQQESEVDVYDVSLGVDEQVAVVAVLDQKNVREQRIRRQARREVLLRRE